MSNAQKNESGDDIEEIYEDDFEKFNDEIEDDEEFLKKLGFIDEDDGNHAKNDQNFVTPPISRMTIESASPESDSAGNKLNSKHLNDFETMTSFDDYDDFENDYEEDASCLSYDFELFRASLNELPMSKQKKYKNGTRSSLTFSNQRMEEIDRENKHLLDKIMRNGPGGDGFVSPVPGISKRKGFSFNNNKPTIRSSAEVNRRKKQQQIEYENQILKRKLDKIASRRSS